MPDKTKSFAQRLKDRTAKRQTGDDAARVKALLDLTLGAAAPADPNADDLEDFQLAYAAICARYAKENRKEPGKYKESDAAVIHASIGEASFIELESEPDDEPDDDHDDDDEVRIGSRSAGSAGNSRVVRPSTARRARR